MARLHRIDLPFCLYHVFSRTIGLLRLDDIAFQDSKDQNKFLEYLERYSSLFAFHVHAWCLMTTHFHLLLESTEQAALSEFIRRLLTAYTIYFNRRHGRHGHLFQGRFKSLVVDKATQLLAVSRYIHLNPARTDRPVDPETYRGSSLRYYLKGGEPPYLVTKETLNWFGEDRMQYGKFVREGMNEETVLPIHARIFVGDKSFGDRMKKRLTVLEKKGSQQEGAKRKRKEAETQKAENLIGLVAKYFGLHKEAVKSGVRSRGITGLARTLSMILLRENLPWTYREITSYMNLSYPSSVIRQIAKIKQKPEIKSHLRKIIKVSLALFMHLQT